MLKRKRKEITVACRIQSSLSHEIELVQKKDEEMFAKPGPALNDGLFALGDIFLRYLPRRSRKTSDRVKRGVYEIFESRLFFYRLQSIANIYDQMKVDVLIDKLVHLNPSHLDDAFSGICSTILFVVCLQEFLDHVWWLKLEYLFGKWDSVYCSSKRYDGLIAENPAWFSKKCIDCTRWSYLWYVESSACARCTVVYWMRRRKKFTTWTKSNEFWSETDIEHCLFFAGQKWELSNDPAFNCYSH